MEDILLVPLRFIRIVKDISQKDIAEYFQVAPSYISAIELGKRDMNTETLMIGLEKMGINYEEYIELEALAEELMSQYMEYEKKYRLMLIKAMGVINPKLKKETEKLLIKSWKITEQSILIKKRVK